MYGPEDQGHWTSHTGPNCGKNYAFLHAGEWYRVVKSFMDFDEDEHSPGEHWEFLGYSFLPYDDGLSLFVSLDGTREWHIRMQDGPEEQGSILENLGDYLEPVTGEPK